jgi:NADH-quinone oxidoreductase subunit E
MEYIDKILNRYHNNSSNIIAILQDMQEEAGYLKREDLMTLSERLEVPVGDIYRIASFFRAFSLVPRGKNIVQVCLGTACHVRGGDKVLGELERNLKIKAGDTTKDGKFTLETVNCLGACALGPIVVVNNKYHGNVIPKKVSEILSQYE